ncbi:hypothetical protein ACQJBY_002002 [Aegilops geniculata]
MSGGGGVVCPPPELSFGGQYYSVVDGVCSRDESFFGGKPVLTQAVGYAVVLGFGAFFALFTSFLVWLEKRYVGGSQLQTSEWFNTAGRSVKTGLIASVIVSQWTWAATILQSSNVAWQYGVSGPFWYASGATVQVLLFGVMAIEIKRKAPNAHTVCEIVRARWGARAHLVFLAFCLATNVIVTAMLLLGGSAVVHALTGVNVYAASFLIPLGVIVYTLAGGLKATFLASYIHSVVVHAVLLVFVFLVYTSSSSLGSPKVVYERLLVVASAARDCSGDLSRSGQSCGPVHGNLKGSYLTMLSSGGLVFGIINIVGNFGTVFVDNVSSALFLNCPSLAPVRRCAGSLDRSRIGIGLIAGILDERNRRSAVVDAQGVPARRPGVVRSAIFAGHITRPRRARPRPPYHRGGGGKGPRPAGHRDRAHGQAWLRPPPHDALHGRHLRWLRRARRRLLPVHLRHLPHLRQPGRFR